MNKRRPSRSPKYREYTEPLKDPDRPPSKKRKSANRVVRGRSGPTMAAFDFQTPHPTLESQSQAFKLPSSSPQPSPRPLSPVPATATSSKHFKENAPKQDKSAIEPGASSTPWNRHSLNAFASMMRMPGHMPPIPLSRKSRRHRPSRSHSRSSSNSNVSSRANSKEPHARKPTPKTNPESKLKHTQSLSSLHPTKTDRPKTQKHKPSSRKSVAAHPRALASPFVSRASSPVNHPTPHIPTPLQPEPGEHHPPKRIIHQYGRKSSTRTALSEIRTPDPNLPRPAQPTQGANPPRQHPIGWLQNVHSSLEPIPTAHIPPNPKKINLTETVVRKTKTPSTKAGQETRLRVYAGSQRDRPLERRPSAPSSLHLPKQLRPAGRLSVLGPGRAGAGNDKDAAPVLGDDKAAAAASGAHVLLDKFPRPPIAPPSQDDVGGNNDDAAKIHPPAPIAEIKDPVLQTLNAGANPSRALPAPPTRHLLHPSASMEDLHATGSQDRRHPARTQGLDDHLNNNDNDEDDRTAWMHARSGVDFNRPPSQMDVAPGAPFGYAAFEDTFFTSSEEESGAEEEGGASGSEYDYEREGAEAEAKNRRALRRDGVPRSRRSSGASLLGPPFGLEGGLGVKSGFGFGFGFENPTAGRELGRAFGDGHHGGGDGDGDGDGEEWVRFGEDAWGVSTPVKDPPGALPAKEGGEMRKDAVPRQGGGKGSGANVEVGGTVLARSGSYDNLKAYRGEEDGDGEEDMELTGSAAGGRVCGREKNGQVDDQEDGEDDVSWSTDSLISAPSIYMERKRRKAAVQDQDRDEDNHVKEQKSSSSTLDGPSYGSSLGLSARPGFQDGHGAVGDLLPTLDMDAAARQDVGAHEFEDQAEQSSESHTHSSSSGASNKTATRTRSGTIVPANPLGATSTTIVIANAIPPGSRRTRSGTIVGPLPAAPPPAFALPPRPDASGHTRVGKAPIRTRSGTIVASASVPQSVDGGGAHGPRHGQGGRGRVRSGSIVQMMSGQSAGVIDAGAGQGQEGDDVVECYTDSLYVPASADASSPDPIDFLRFAGIAEAENEDDDEDVEWRVVREPPSPETRKGKQRQQPQRGRGGAFRGLATRAASAGRWLTRGKGAGARKGAKARKGGGVEENEDDEDALGDAEDSSEDELLLVPGATAKFWS